MNATLKASQWFTAVAALSVSGCLVPHEKMIRTVDRSAPMENAYLWRQVKQNPAAYVPKSLPPGAPTGPKHGKWIVDPQDQVSFFVPATVCGNLSPGVWEGEAMKSTNRYSLQEQRRKNVHTGLMRWPVEAVVNAVAAYGSAAR